MIRIRLIDPQQQNKPREIDLKPETLLNQECLIGRSSNCNLVLDSTEVSRMHGKIAEKNGNYYFTDLASSCGSRINGENAQINQDYLLNNSDIIQIGRFSLEILQIGSVEDITLIESQKNTADSALAPCVSPVEYMPVAMIEPSQLQRWDKGELTVCCIGIIDETHDVKTFRFVANPPVLFTYKPGQCVTLELEINGEQRSHSYFISSTPSRPHTLEITIKRQTSDNSRQSIQDVASNWLHEFVTVGSKVKIKELFGNFTCFTNPSQKLLLISAGSGIAPMMSMSRWLFDTGANCDIIFFHSARTPFDIIFRQELELICATHPNFHLVVTTTRKKTGQSWLSLTGRLNTAMLQIIAPDLSDRTVYVCGPQAFMADVNQMLASLNFLMENYHDQTFRPPEQNSRLPKYQGATKNTSNNFISPVTFMFPTETHLESNVSYTHTSTLPKSTDSTQIRVVFSKSGKEIIGNCKKSLLDLASQEGVKIPSTCHQGVCGRCKKRKLEGEVRLEAKPFGLDESEITQGYILTCISYPIGSVVIEA